MNLEYKKVDISKQMDNVFKSNFNQKKTRCVINEIPIMISEDGKIVCIKKSFDEPVIGFTGLRGCLSDDEEIIINGVPIKIKDVKINNKVISLNKINIKEEKVLDVIDNGIKEVYEVKTKSGRTVKCSNNHIFLVREKNEIIEKEMKNLKADDLVPIIYNSFKGKEINFYANYLLDWDFGFFIGLYLSEGHCIKSNGTGIGFTFCDDSIGHELIRILDKMKIEYRIHYRKTHSCIYDITTKKTKEFNIFLREEFKTGAKIKTIPNWVFNSNKDFIKGLLSGYMSGDGSVVLRDNKKDVRIKFDSVSKELRDKIAYLFMQRLDIFVFLNEFDKSKINPKWNRNYSGEISQNDLIKFYDNIKIIDDGTKSIKIKKALLMETRKLKYNQDFTKALDYLKEERSINELRQILGGKRERIETMIEQGLELGLIEKNKKKELNNYEQNIKNYNIRFLKESRLGKKCIKLSNYLKEKKEILLIDLLKQMNEEKNFQNFYRAIDTMEKRKEIKKIPIDKQTSVDRISLVNYYKIKEHHKNIYWDKIENIKFIGKSRVYDLKIDEYNNFTLANGLVVHNSGKSTGLHALLDRVYWYYMGTKNETACIFLNDRQEETPTYNYPNIWGGKQKERGDNKELQISNETPRPLPMAYIYPNTSTLSFKNDWNRFKMSIPFSYIISNIEQFFDLGKSAMYFKNMKPQLIQFKTEQEFYSYFNMLAGGDKNPTEMINKLLNYMMFLFKDKMIELADEDALNYLYYNKLKEDGKLIPLSPVVALSEAGVIPSVITSDLITKPYFTTYMRYLIEGIFEAQIKYFKNKSMWVFIDELQEISTVKNKTIASESLQRLASQGRPQRLGFVYASTNYSKIELPIRTNTHYLFTFTHKNRDEVNEIAANWDLENSDKERIINLKKFEVMGVTSEEFICYDEYGEKEIVQKVFGKMLPPLSLHKMPKAVQK